MRSATRADVGAAERLLAACDLPVEDLAELLRDHAADFVVADDPGTPGELAAIAGLEVRGPHALLRSVAVRPEWRKRGVGDELVRHLVCEAESRGLRALYLLTMTAERYFPRLGFERIERDSVPAEIADTREFRSTCPASAIAMCRRVLA
ncbi:MAG TPA: arsenic resistance N-acetyltransferase ArsN2 [Gemmatimonadaceae bacterium]|nr:arsenic resistance N-acetyltransferase ArsN2 [Gemmatimonadaceae bacterium]